MSQTSRHGRTGPTENTGQTENTVWHPSAVDRATRWGVAGGQGITVWLTGLSGSGKSTVAVELERLLLDQGRPAYLLDGDNLRHGLNGDLGFSDDDRHENIRRVAHLARLFADAGFVAIVPLISPFRAARRHARTLHIDADLGFVEVYVATPLDLCEQRDPKGLYARARAGEIDKMTGIDSPYEPPDEADVLLSPADGTPTEMASKVLAYL